MTKQEKLKKGLRDQLEEERFNISDKGYSVISDAIEYYDFDNEDDFREHIYECVGDAFIYYSSAMDYLSDQNIYDFEDAIKEYGTYNVCGIASYYLEQEVLDFISEHLDFSELNDEDEEDEEDENEEG